MKKATRILGVLTLIFSLFLGLGLNAMEMAEAAPDEVTVTLHKKKMTALPEFQQNTGKEMDFFSSYDDMPNVDFTAYDVSDQFYGLRAGGSTFEAALTAVATSPDTTEPRGTATTGTNGQVSFNLAAKSDGKDAIYVFVEFVETAAPSGTTPADNLVLALPMYDANDELMTDILLYPKNLVKADGRVTVTKKDTANHDVLAGAQFIVSRELTTGNVEYLASFNMEKGLYNWVSDSDRENALPFTTDNAGTFSILGLEHGTYNLIEIATPENASIIGDGMTEFTIKENNTNKALTIYNDKIEVDKEHEGDATDYNVGDLIPYSITVNVPEGIAYVGDDGSRHVSMVITDLPDAGLQYNNDLSAAGLTIDPSWIDTTGTNGFVLTIPAAELADLSGDDLILTYNMYLDGTANPDVGYNNLVKVHTRELKDEDGTKEVFTGGKKFRKVDKNFDSKNALAGAVFVVRNSDLDSAKYLKVDETTKAVSWVDIEAEATKYTSATDTGLVFVRGLEEGTYWLEEIEAPTDYVLRDEKTEFAVEIGKYETTPLDVVNIRKGRLPSTGGTGIVGILGLGAVLLTTTGGYYIKRKREE